MNDLISPTESFYTGLNRAYEWFNMRLFANKLPGALITLQRQKSCIGYYTHSRFKARGAQDRELDEIALNPSYFGVFPIIDTLSTLAHEQAHQYQHHIGTPSRGGYHNAQWAEIMLNIGLQPSSTGREGGATTGPSMSHMIIAGGKFDVAARELMDADFQLQWFDRFPPPGITSSSGKATVSTNTSGKVIATPPKLVVDVPDAIAMVPSADTGERSALPPTAAVVVVQAPQQPQPSTAPSSVGRAAPTAAPLPRPPPPTTDRVVLLKSVEATNDGARVTLIPKALSAPRNKIKYRCPKCGSQAWGKPQLKLVCGDDLSPYQAIAAADDDLPDGLKAA